MATEHELTFVRAAILQALLKKPMYGNQILHEYANVFVFGTLFPTLKQLEGHGYLSSEKRPVPVGETGPARIYYIVTKDGRAALTKFKKQNKEILEMLNG